jgi:hypothetical protein
MGAFRAFRDVDASLWQSALDTVAARQAAGLPRFAAAAGALPLPSLANPLAPLGVAAGHWLLHVKELQGDTLGGGIAGGLAATAASEDALRAAQAVTLARALPISPDQFVQALTVQFGHHDPLWLETAYYYFTYLATERALGVSPYRAPPAPDESTLPNRARVALWGDWGTGTPEASALIERILARKPDVLIHLGDIYYSGRQPEIESRFVAPLQQARAKLGVPKVPTYSLCGNHDMYSGGQPYYGLLDQLGQPASCFCLRNDHWQLIALDTGHNSGLLPPDRTWLQDAEVAWLSALLATAGSRKTILLSHHQLFSALEEIDTEKDGLNHKLYEQVAPILHRVTCWFWGHEHNLVIYQPYAPVEGGPTILARCIGHGAIPVARDEQGKMPDGRNMKMEAVQLGLTNGFFNHGYAILDLDNATAHVSYYQSTPGEEESWGGDTF